MKINLMIACAAVTVFGSLSATSQDISSCSAALEPSAKLVFDDALADVTAGGDLKEVVTEHTKALVKAGKLTRGEARPAAIAASECLKLASN